MDNDIWGGGELGLWGEFPLKTGSRVFYVPNITPDQLPVGLLAQLVKQCTGIAEFMCSNPKIKSEDRFHIHIIFMSSTTVETIFINLILTIFIKSKECAPQREQ